MPQIVKVYVPLLEEAIPTVRGTQAISLGDDLYNLLPTPDYDPEDEIWEFKPGSVVRCHERSDEEGKKYLCAHAVRKDDGTFVLSEELRNEFE